MTQLDNMRSPTQSHSAASRYDNPHCRNKPLAAPLPHPGTRSDWTRPKQLFAGQSLESLAGTKVIGEPFVFIVDDDCGVRESLLQLLESHGMQAVTFESAAEYISFLRPNVPACLILDVSLLDTNGLDLQRQLAGTNHPPIVFITGNGDIPSSVRAMKAGAVDFLTKPFREQDLLKAIGEAIAGDSQARIVRAALDRLLQRYSLLTPREREVLPLVIGGLLNKQAGAELGISEITLQIHRSKIMQKMKADSLAELVRMAGQLKVPLPSSHRRGGVDRQGN